MTAAISSQNNQEMQLVAHPFTANEISNGATGNSTNHCAKSQYGSKQRILQPSIAQRVELENLKH